MIDKKIILCIMDGWGISNQSRNNAIHYADTKNYDYFLKNYPNTELVASEKGVGLPTNQFGNSEVGHMNIGAGRVILQDILRINESIKHGRMSNNPKLNKIKESCQNIHILGLISSGGVHGHIDHLIAIIDILKENKNKIFIHCILDGRDTAPTSGIKFMKVLLDKINESENISVASISGRYFTMDRDNRWERVEQAYNSIISGISKNKFTCPIDAIQKSYDSALTDEFFQPISNKNYSGCKDNDAFIITNYRADRVREILSSIFDEQFDFFPRKTKINFSYKIGLVEYSKRLSKSLDSLFTNPRINNTLGQLLAQLNLKQLRIAETEKYAHVTYFFNGGVEEKYNGEERILIPSPRVKTYDMCPEMGSYEMTKKLVEQIKTKNYEFILVNYANTDMVGHTGNFDATVKAVEVIDRCIGEIYKTAKINDYILVLTSDHGNADQMRYSSDNSICTTHSMNPVPLIICSEKNFNLKKGCLADIAPTILELMKIDKPKEMTGISRIA